MLSDDGSGPRTPGGRRRPFASVLHRPGSPRVELPGVTGVPGQPGVPSEIPTPGSTGMPTVATTGTRATVAASDVAIVVDRATNASGHRRAPGSDAHGAVRHDPRRHRAERRRQDDDDPPDDRRPRADSGRGARPRREPAPFPPPDPRADRLHAAALRALPRPDGAARTSAFVASLFGMLWRRRRRPGPRGAGARRPVGRAGPARERPVGRHAAPPRAGLRPGPRARRCCSSTSRRPGIDPLLRKTIWDELHRLRADGRTLLVTTQYVGEAEECDQVALIADGRLIALAPPDELRRSALGGEVVEIETTRAFDGARSRDTADRPSRPPAGPARISGSSPTTPGCGHAGPRRGGRGGRRRRGLGTRVPAVVRRRLRRTGQPQPGRGRRSRRWNRPDRRVARAPPAHRGRRTDGAA